MSYTLHLFAIDGRQFADKLGKSAEEVLKGVREKIFLEKRCDEASARPVLRAAERLCSGNLPVDCPIEYFDALCWLGVVEGEPVKLGCFDSMKYSYFDRVAIWPWMRRRSPPFSIPDSAETPPEAGYLSADDISGWALSAFDELPVTNDAEVMFARTQFREILESLAEDRLDLLGVVM
ncbi:MAG TPA: hypothetical protein VMP01_29010 [Pirellulaceae bacterium]|nr:hypothetical protein [Pirellulaceae bacterium]